MVSQISASDWNVLQAASSSSKKSICRSRLTVNSQSPVVAVRTGANVGAGVSTGVTVGAPGVTVGAPGVTVGAPGVTVGAPGVTVGAPGVTVGAPGVTVGAPGVTVGAPGVTVGAPGVTVGAVVGLPLGLPGDVVGSVSGGIVGFPLGLPGNVVGTNVFGRNVGNLVKSLAAERLLLDFDLESAFDPDFAVDLVLLPLPLLALLALFDLLSFPLLLLDCKLRIKCCSYDTGTGTGTGTGTDTDTNTSPYR